MSSHFCSRLSARWIFIALLLSVVSTPPLVAEDRCAELIPVTPGTVLRDVLGDTRLACYSLELPSAGRLLLEVSADRESSTLEPRLEVYACSGDPASAAQVRIHHRGTSSWLGEVGAATRVAACVRATPPSRLASIKLSSAFARQVPTKGGDPNEDEPEPDGLIVQQLPTQGGDPNEDEPEPDGLILGQLPTQGGDPNEDEPEPDGLIGARVQLGSIGQLPNPGGDPNEDEPEPDGLIVQQLPTQGGDPNEDEPEPDGLIDGEDVCRTATSDDHSDLFHCATLLTPGRNLEAEINNPWGDDEDVFALLVEKLTTVRFRLASTIPAHLTLHDRFGHRLWTPEASDTSDRRWAQTLAPGLYFLRVDAPLASGSYRLRAELD